MRKLPEFSCVVFKDYRCDFDFEVGILKGSFDLQSPVSEDPIDFKNSSVRYGNFTSKFIGPYNNFIFSLTLDAVQNCPLEFELHYFDGRVETVTHEFLFSDLADLPSTFYNADILQLYTDYERFSDPELLNKTLEKIFNRITSDKNKIIPMAMSAYEWHLLHQALDDISDDYRSVSINEPIISFLGKFLALMRDDVVYPFFQGQYKFLLSCRKSFVHESKFIRRY